MHVAITDVTADLILLPSNSVGVQALISHGETAGTNAVQLTRHDVCHLDMFFFLYM